MSNNHIIHNPNYKERIIAGYKQQAIMDTFGAKIRLIEPGIVELELPFRPELTQQHGFFHAGVVTTMMDNACGYAAVTLFPPDIDVLTIEFKANFLSPATGAKLVARGEVVKAGRTITVCNGTAVMEQENGQRKTVAQLVATLIAAPQAAETAKKKKGGKSAK